MVRLFINTHRIGFFVDRGRRHSAQGEVDGGFRLQTTDAFHLVFAVCLSRGNLEGVLHRSPGISLEAGLDCLDRSGGDVPAQFDHFTREEPVEGDRDPRIRRSGRWCKHQTRFDPDRLRRQLAARRALAQHIMQSAGCSWNRDDHGAGALIGRHE